MTETPQRHPDIDRDGRWGRLRDTRWEERGRQRNREQDLGTLSPGGPDTALSLSPPPWTAAPTSPSMPGLARVTQNGAG